MFSSGFYGVILWDNNNLYTCIIWNGMCVYIYIYINAWVCLKMKR